MEIARLKFPGTFKIISECVRDQRGVFVKTFEEHAYREKGLRMDVAERFFSVSRKDVIRGLHFQVPPHEHFKTVTCTYGTVVDVTVDLRVGSPTFQQVDVIELDGAGGWTLYLPPGIAHGFLTKSDISVVVYEVTSAHSPPHDKGVRWDSIPFNWGVDAPVLSARDLALPPLSRFQSPFQFGAE